MLCRFDPQLNRLVKETIHICVLSDNLEPIKKIPYGYEIFLMKNTKYLLFINGFFIPFPAQSNPVVIDGEKAYCIAKKSVFKKEPPILKKIKILIPSNSTGKLEQTNFLFRSLQNQICIEFEIENHKNNACINVFFIKENLRLSAFVFDTYEKGLNPKRIISAKTNMSKMEGSCLNVLIYLNGRMEKYFKLELKDLVYKNINHWYKNG